jgi:soluble lytic murein transglycosylase
MQAQVPGASDGVLARLAIAAADRQQFDEAARLAGQAGDRLLGKIVQWIQYGAANGGASFDAIAGFVAANPDWPLLAVLRRQAEAVMPDDLPATQVLAWYKSAAPQTVPGVLRYAGALAASGDAPRAARAVRERWIDGTFTPAEEQDFLLRTGDQLQPADHLARLERLLWDHQPVPARRLLARGVVDDGHAALAEARLALDSDLRTIDGVLAKVPAAFQNDPGLLYERARNRRRAGDDMGALDILLHPPAESGRPAAWWNERNIVARRAIDRGDTATAYRLAAGHGSSDSQVVVQGEFLAGWLALRFRNDPATALGHFQALLRASTIPTSKSRASYWVARAAEAAGDTAQARVWYQRAAAFTTTFYGQLAFGRLEADGAITLPAEPRPTPAQTAAFEKRELVRVARLLTQAVARDDERLGATLRRIGLSVREPAEFVLSARLSQESGRQDMAVATARDASQTDVFLVENGYPLLAGSAAAGTPPEPALVHALIRQESTFNPGVVSPVGARGLMQLMPATAQVVATRLGLKQHNAIRLTADPAYNVRLGSAYLQELMERFNGSPILAVAGYNAGPNRVRGWLDQYGDPRAGTVDPVDWIELIPFNETRNYVQRVLEALLVYRARLDGGRGGLNLDRELRR